MRGWKGKLESPELRAGGKATLFESENSWQTQPWKSENSAWDRDRVRDGERGREQGETDRQKD